MTFTVVWRQRALDEVAAAWIEATDRSQISDSIRRIDMSLRLNPELKGVDFYGDRLLVAGPLAVVFTVRPSDCIVEILQVLASRAAQ